MKYLPFLPAALLLSTTLASTLQAVPIRVSIPWERTWPVVTPSTAESFRFQLKNEGPEPGQADFTATLTPPSGAELRIHQSVALAAGEETSIPLSLAGQEFGSWLLQFTVSQASAPAQTTSEKIRFAYMKPAGPDKIRPEFYFGIVAHSERLPAPERQLQLEAAAFAGCKVLRSNPGWQSVQPRQGEWKWEVMDQMVSSAEQLGMELEVLLAYTPKWAAPADKQAGDNWLLWNRAAPDMQAWREYVAAYAGRYRGRVRLWETWNEPDLDGFWKGTTEEFIELLKISAEEVRKADPGNLVMGPGYATLTPHQGRRLNPDLQARSLKAVGPQLSFHTVHEHGSFAQFAQLVDGPYARLRAELPAPVPPLFFNETAMHSVGGTELEQARILVKKASFARSRGAKGYLWYDLRDDGSEPTDPEHHFGLLTYRMEPKPVYVAFSTFAQLAVRRPYLQQIAMGDNRWFFVFGDESEKLLLFWNDDTGSQGEQILLRLPGAVRAQLLDLNGNATNLPLSGDLVVVPAGKDPCYLLATGAKAIEGAGKLAGPSRSFFGGPGEQITVDCEFTNPTSTRKEVSVRWETSPGIQKIETPPAIIALPAKDKSVSILTVRLPDGADYRFGGESKLRVNYEFSGMPYRGTIQIPIHYGTIAIPADKPGRSADITLNRKEQLFSFIEADPNLAGWRWKGAEDLSANIWMSIDPQNLNLRVAVTDNQHVQGFSPAEIWRADSVQCMLSIPGQKGYWEFGFAQDQAGRVSTMIWDRPENGTDFTSHMRVEVETKGEGRIYHVSVPRKELGLTDQILREGFRFNVAVNDSDGQVRAHALQLVPGLVENKSVESAPYVVFRPSAE